MEIRTDLALERHENFSGSEINGVIVTKQTVGSVKITKIEVTDKNGEQALGKPVGVYYTLETDGFPDISSLCDERLFALKNILSELIPQNGCVLVVGTGNSQITPDALGPKCASMIFSTRHIDKKTLSELGLPSLRQVCAVAPGVTGQTGLEATEIVSAVCEKIKPQAVIAVDALASASITRLANTVQISTAGIEPGSGVGNARKAINQTTLGVPVIAIGVPTVVDALSLANDVFPTNSAFRESPDRTADYAPEAAVPDTPHPTSSSSVSLEFAATNTPDSTNATNATNTTNTPDSTNATNAPDTPDSTNATPYSAPSPSASAPSPSASAPPAGKSEFASFMVTPKNIDTVIDSASRFLALAINSVLHPDLTEKELISLM